MTQIHQAWFPREEYLHRLERVQQQLQQRQLAALLLFQPESITYLSGFHTPDLGPFQCVVVPVEGNPRVICSQSSHYQLTASCLFPETYCWGETEAPLPLTAQILRPLVAQGERVGLELAGLGAHHYQQLLETLADLRFEAADDILQQLRRRKSLTELACHRRAAGAVDMALQTAATIVEPGMSERELAAQVSAALIEAGSDQPSVGNLCAGERAHHPHGVYSDREFQSEDLLQLDLCAGVRHYQARCMRPLRLGETTAADHQLAETLLNLQDEALGAVRPGVPATVPEAIYRDGVLSRGLEPAQGGPGFRSLGLMFSPWGDEGLASTPSCDWLFEENMVLHTHLLVQGFGFAETIAVTTDGYERLTQFPRSLLTR